jgi:hypothetical protein
LTETSAMIGRDNPRGGLRDRETPRASGRMKHCVARHNTRDDLYRRGTRPGPRGVPLVLDPYGKRYTAEFKRDAVAQFALETGTKVHFADPHSPWQRPTNEDSNRLPRLPERHRPVTVDPRRPRNRRLGARRANPQAGMSRTHAVGSLVLVYMSVAGVAPSTLHGTAAGENTMAGMPGMYVDTTIAFPAIGLICVAAMAFYAATSSSRLSPTQPDASAAPSVAFAILSKLV